LYKMKNTDWRKILFGIPQRDEVTFKKVALIVTCTLGSVVLNYYGSIFAGHIVFPLYLDSVFTLFVTAAFGLVPGLVCAIGSNLMLTVFQNASFLFVLCHLCTVILAWLIFLGAEKNYEQSGEITFHFFLWAALFSAITNAILGNIIVDIVFGSVTGRPQADFVVQAIFSAVPNRIFATYFAGFIENLTDKMISACISFTCFKMLKNNLNF